MTPLHSQGQVAATPRPGPDWFTNGYAQDAFQRHLRPWARQPGLRFLQIGAYCGDASVWLLNNILTSPEALLVDVDTWQGSDEVAHDEIDFAEVFTYYTGRVWGRNLHVKQMTSDEFFTTNWPPFDFVYIDGDHRPDQVLRDAIHAEAVLKPGGLMAFDDYRWGAGMRDVPAPAIDAFLRCYENKIDVLEKHLQVWVRKK